MRNLTFKKSLWIFFSILMLNAVNLYSQNTYLSFLEGTKGQVEGMKTLPDRTFQNLKSNSVEIGYKFTGAYVAETTVEKTTYNFLHIEGFAKMTQVGAPALPAHTEIIAMPRGSQAKIVIISADYVEYDGYMVHPTLEPARDTYGAPSPEFERDEKIYSADEFFPKNIVEVTNTGIIRGTPLAYVEVRPVQFNPVTGKIRVYSNIKYQVIPEGGESNFDYIGIENSLHFTNMLKRRVINSESIPNGISQADQKNNKSGAKNYIIITHSEYITQANELANWKRQMGYSVEVVSQSSWTAAQVKSEIQTRYAAWTPKPDYFVIIGDHTGSYAVPGEIHQDPSYGDDFATDLYAACMDGGSDHIPDIAHGRISVSSVTEAQVVVDKIINYEKTPPTQSSYYSNMLNCAQYQDVEDTEADDGYAARRFCHTSENIRDYMQNNQGYTSERVYYTESTWSVTDLHYNNGYYSTGNLLPTELRNASFNWSGDETDITNAINAGKFLVFHRDHGYTGGIGWAHPFFLGQNTYGYPDNIAGLSNGVNQPVLFSMNCHTGEFQLDNCFAEEFLRVENKGAVGVFGAAYYSYSGYNDALSIGMIDAIWSAPGLSAVFGSGGTGSSYTIGAGNDIYTMGDVLNQGLYAMIQNWGDNTYTHELFHYFGDPAMKIWTANPNNNIITATHSSTIDCANSTFSISGSTAGAVATLVYNNELLGETTLDGSGAGSIPYTLSVAGDVTLTISKHNNKPYVTTLTQTCAGYPPTVVTNAVTAITSTTATLNGEVTNNNGETITESGFVYSLTSNPVIGGAGVTQVTHSTPAVEVYNEAITGLTASTTYYYKAYATSSNGTSYGDEVSFTSLCGSFTLPYSQNFNSGDGCWEGDGGTANWFNVSPTVAHDGNCFVTNGNSNYSNDSYILTSPQINMSNYTNNTVTFYMWMDVESNTNFYDGGFIECYNGTSWVKMTNSELSVNYDGTLSSGYSNPYGGEDAYSTDRTTWTQVTITLPASFNNVSNFQIRYKFGGDNSGYYTGWAIDDVAITGTPNTTTPTATVSSTPGCGTGTVRVSSDLSGTQTFELYNSNGTSLLASNTINATYYDFASQSDGTYTGKVTKDGQTSTLSSTTTLTNTAIPTITATTPNSRCGTGAVTLGATSSAGTINWYAASTGGSSLGTGTSFTTPSISSTTTYYIDATDGACTTSSRTTVVATITPATAITTQPTNQSACTGGNATFTVVADNATAYQWKKDGSDISGATSATLNLTTVSSTDAASYSCVVIGTCGNVTSDAVTLTVVGSTSITTQPTSQTVCESTNVTFSVVATGSNITYQWQFNGTDISGATSADYTITGVTDTDTGSYTCVVNSDCGSATSDVAVLTINPATEITTQPFSLTDIEEGETVVFTVVANGSNLSYEWFKDATSITDATLNTYTIVGVTAEDEGEYYVTVTGDCGNATSSTANLTVITDISTITDLGMNIFPNPSTGDFTISFDNMNSSFEMTIIDELGRTIYTGNLTEKSNHVNIGSQAPGVYLMKVYNQETSKTIKLIIE